MAKIVIECADHLVKTFCGWFSNQGEQDLFEAHSNGKWNEETQKWEEQTTYLATEGYGINEPIRLVEYDKETDERVPYFDGEKLSAMQAMVPNTGQIFELRMPK